MIYFFNIKIPYKYNMGIKGLRKVLKANKYESKKIDSRTFFRNNQYSVIGIDVSIFLFKYICIFQENYLNGFLSQINFLLKNKIIPVFVFDGIPTAEKENLQEQRKEKYDKAKKNIIEKELEILNMESFDSNVNEERKKLNKQKKNCIKITPEIVNNVKKLFKFFGLFAYEYDGEADLFLRYLFEQKLVDYVISEDMDLLTHGCERVITKFNTSSKPMELFVIKDILKDLEMNKESFIDLCIMLGCDYTGTPIGIGPVTAVKYVKKYKSIEKIKEALKNNKNIDFGPMDEKMARNMFLCEVSIPEKLTRKKFYPKYKKKITNVHSFLSGYKIKKEKIDSTILELKNFRNDLKTLL